MPTLIIYCSVHDVLQALNDAFKREFPNRLKDFDQDAWNSCFEVIINGIRM